jgi:hypothetical protein
MKTKDTKNKDIGGESEWRAPEPQPHASPGWEKRAPEIEELFSV